MEYKWTVLTVTTIGVLMAGIDSRVLIVGLPQVAAALGADAEQAIWLTQSYMLGSTVVLLLIGRLTDLFGRVKIYVIGFAIFTISSALISLSNGVLEVILWRGLQGFGSGVLFTNSVTMIVDATPAKNLGFSLGLNMNAFRFGAMAGLTLSGMLLAFLSWRGIFYINIPIGIFGALWAHRRLKEVKRVEAGEPVDLIGFFTFTAAITSLLFFLTFAAYGIAGGIVVYSLLGVFVVGLLAFVAHERRTRYPLFDLKLLRIKEFTGGIVAQLLNAAAWGAVLLLLSLYLQLVSGFSAFETGIRLIPFEIAFLAVGTISGRLSDKFGCLPFATSGLALMSVVLFMLSTVGASTPYSQVLVLTVLFGVGMGLFSSPNMSSIMGCVPSERRGVASAFRSTVFQIGFTVSLNLAVLLMTLTIPFVQLTQIMTSLDPVAISGPDKLLFVEGIQNAYIGLAVLNTAAIVPSVLRGKRSSEKTIAQAYNGKRRAAPLVDS